MAKPNGKTNGRGKKGYFTKGNTHGFKKGVAANPHGNKGPQLAAHIKAELAKLDPKTQTEYGILFARRLIDLATTDPSWDDRHLVPLHAAALKFVAERLWPKTEIGKLQALQIIVHSDAGRQVMETIVEQADGSPGRADLRKALRNMAPKGLLESDTEG